MSQPLFFHKGLGCFRPADGAAEAALSKIRMGDTVQVEIKRPRNIQHHRLFWALLTKVFQNQDYYESLEHMRVALQVAVGHCDTVILKNGDPAYIPRSISFANMDQTEFDAFFDRCVQIVIRHWLPGVTDEELKAEVLEMVR